MSDVQLASWWIQTQGNKLIILSSSEAPYFLNGKGLERPSVPNEWPLTAIRSQMVISLHKNMAFD